MIETLTHCEKGTSSSEPCGRIGTGPSFFGNTVEEKLVVVWKIIFELIMQY